jgi:predicted outer membrane repeat protein
MQRLAVCCLLVWSIAYQISSPVVSQQAADTEGTLSVNGYVRKFIYAVSAHAAPATGRPLVIHLHGDEGNMRLSPEWKNAVLDDANGAVLLSAQGRNNIPDAAAIDGSAWRFRMDEAGAPYDDVDFIDQLITRATSNDMLLGTPIDPNQVYVVGESRGAGFAYVLYADPRTRNKIRAIVPISGTFYCDGEAPNPDTTCGEVDANGDWGPKPSLFSAPGVTRAAHILDIHGQLPPNGGEGEDTAPPVLDKDWGATTWHGWGDAAGCYTQLVSSQTEQTLAEPIDGKTVKTYAYSQAAGNLATRCISLDLTFYIVQGGGHVPNGFEPTAWCFLSAVGGIANNNACQSTKVVGDGTTGSCTEAALDAVLSGSGTITFNCGTAQIDLSSTKTIQAHTTIDGGGMLTLSGQNARRLFVVNGGASLTLRNIVLTNGSSSGDGGAIYNDLGGALILENSTIRNSKAGASGGAIVSYGALTIAGSRLENNEALNGGALYPRWSGAQTTIVGSVLFNNRATDTTDGWGGAILAWDGAAVTIEGSDISSNSARNGGGIYNFDNSILTLQSNTLLQNNVATLSGGGVFNAGTATLSNVTLNGNSASIGGGLASVGTATLSNVTLNGNSASSGGGLINGGSATLNNITLNGNSATNSGGGLYNNSTTALSNVTLSGNTAANGGGLYSYNGTATLSNVTLSGNSATNDGGGIYEDGGTATLSNVTLSGNSATNGGGIFNNFGTTTLTNATLSGNSATNGGGIYRKDGLVQVMNTIVANNPLGGNCVGGVTNNGFNLSSDNTCGFGIGRDNVNLMLDPLANNGGPTKTHMLQPGSPAIDNVATGCPPPSTDQRGGMRPVDGDGDGSALCDVGAVEYGAMLPRVSMPTVLK